MNSTPESPHQEHFTVSAFSTYLKEIVYGGTDGIVTTFAVVAGFVGSQSSNSVSLPIITVLLFGFANLLADGVSMSLGNFLSSRSEVDVYKNRKRKERREIQQNPQEEIEETRKILEEKGFTSQDAMTLTAIYQKNENYWLDFMMNHELEIPNPENQSNILMATATGLSFVCFGLIPLIPYVLFRENGSVFLFSCIATAFALTALGLLRWKISRQGFVRSLGETLILGGCAAVIAYVVGTLFHF